MKIKNIVITCSVWLTLILAIWVGNHLPSPDAQVTLRSGPSNDIVQMWANPGSGGDASAWFPSGTPCTKLDGPHVRELSEGISSTYYRLTCRGQTGYVNVRFVND